MSGMDVPAAGSIEISDLIGAPLVRIPVDATVTVAAQAIIKAGVGAVIVGDDARPAALLSERDVALVVAAGRDPAKVPAAEVASTDLVWCEAGDTVDAVAMKMTDRHIRHILVEDDEVLVGIVSARDLLGVYASDADLEPTL
ncbi:MAG TPA: CBS domain-containing protein [Mycobacterium sp.]|nr:CBS domain-containing protein [Mycobacterium sp.]